MITNIGYSFWFIIFFFGYSVISNKLFYTFDCGCKREVIVKEDQITFFYNCKKTCLGKSFFIFEEFYTVWQTGGGRKHSVLTQCTDMLNTTDPLLLHSGLFTLPANAHEGQCSRQAL